MGGSVLVIVINDCEALKTEMQLEVTSGKTRDSGIPSSLPSSFRQAWQPFYWIRALDSFRWTLTALLEALVPATDSVTAFADH
jgi:hypothetical protein